MRISRAVPIARPVQAYAVRLTLGTHANSPHATPLITRYVRYGASPRAAQTLEAAISHGTTRMRTHVEVDPGVGLRGFEGVAALVDEYRWAIDIEICIFPQEGLLNNPGTDELMVEALRSGGREWLKSITSPAPPSS